MPRYTPEQLEEAHRIRHEPGGSARKAAAATGIGVSTILIHCRRTCGLNLDHELRDLAVKVLDGLDPIPLLPGHVTGDPAEIRATWNAIVDDLRSRP